MAKGRAWVAGAAILMLAGQGLASQARAASLDPRKPADLAAILKEAGAVGEMKTDERGFAYFDAKQDGLAFSVEFRDCDAGNKTCQAAYYMASWDMEAPAPEVLNLWNDVTYFCAAFKGTDGDPYLKMGFLPKATDSKAGLLEDHKKWMGCVEEFKALLSDPDGFVSSIK